MGQFISEIHNGYRVTGNHRNVGKGHGREYHVKNAAGEVLQVCDSKRGAIEHARCESPGDVKPPPPPKPSAPAISTVRPAK